MGIIISTTSIASVRYIKILTWLQGFESATFSLRIRLPSTHIRCIRHTNPQLFESALQIERKYLNTLWIRNRVDAKSGKFTVNIQDGAKRNVIVFLWTLVSSLITSYLHRPQLCHTAARHFNLLSMSDGRMSRIGSRKQVKRASKCFVGQFC